jgi:hypothetical protein
MSCVILAPRSIGSTARLLAATAASFLGVGSALAGPPLITDDSETPGRGGWEINLSHNIESTRDEFLMESPLVDINYGWLDNDQWKLEFPVLSVDPEGEEGQWGVGDLLLGWKYRFIEEDDAGFMASVYPQALAPTGNERLGLSDGFFELLLPLQVGKHFHDDKLFVYGEVGYNVVFDSAGVNEWIYGIAAEWQATEGLVLALEVGGVTFEGAGEPDHTFFNGGLKYQLSERFTFITSAGRSFRDRSAGAPELLTFVGVQITFGENGADDEQPQP